ncbi:MAG: hypothetical protein MHM6MM_008472 [Cercozoa sp. M6MM]
MFKLKFAKVLALRHANRSAEVVLAYMARMALTNAAETLLPPHDERVATDICFYKVWLLNRQRFTTWSPGNLYGDNIY